MFIILHYRLHENTLSSSYILYTTIKNSATQVEV
jgi:hypothetical protein